MFKLPNITTQVAEVAPEDVLDSIDRALILAPPPHPLAFYRRQAWVSLWTWR